MLTNHSLVVSFLCVILTNQSWLFQSSSCSGWVQCAAESDQQPAERVLQGDLAQRVQQDEEAGGGGGGGGQWSDVETSEQVSVRCNIREQVYMTVTDTVALSTKEFGSLSSSTNDQSN